jgi:flavin-dependent dehydrogenase
LKLDVAIVGGGLAGNLLARQLKRTVPELEVGLFERSTEPSYKVGESVVEIGSNYLIRRQGLQRYLYEEHFPKNGLRYFFDDESRSTPLQEMSEIGPINFPFHPAFQIDRARLERDLLEMNRRAGVHVHTGTKVADLQLGERGSSHQFKVEKVGDETGDGSKTESVTCRWLADAAGRAELIARAKGLRVREEEHRIGSVWGRFRGVADIDDLGPEAFHARVRHSSRGLSTMHFFYPGYWMWFIPLRHGITSVGVTGEPVANEPGIRTAEGMRAFLDRHPAVATLLERAENVDVAGYTQIAYGTKRFFHADRWGLTGEAASAADPLYSPGTDFIALENDFLTDLIRRDHAGEAASALAERLELYDRFMAFRHEATMLLYRGQYPTFGSFELMRIKWELDIGSYFNLWATAYMQDQHLDVRWLKRQLRLQPFVLKALRNFGDLFCRVAETLRAEGRFYARNRGEFSYGLENIDFVPRVGLPRSRREVLEKTEEIFARVRRQALELIGENGHAELAADPPLSAFLSDSPIA